MTGVWGYFDPVTEGGAAAISYPFKLAKPIAEENIIFLEEGEEETEDCPGTPEDPQATSGKLCIYEKQGEAVPFELDGFPSSSVSGASVLFLHSFGFGTWAVKAE